MAANSIGQLTSVRQLDFLVEYDLYVRSYICLYAGETFNIKLCLEMYLR